MSIYFLNAECNYPQPLVDEVITMVKKYVEFATENLSIEKPFDITIYPNYTWTAGVEGVDGEAFSGGLLQLRLDLRNELFKISDLLGDPLKVTICHECNHIARWQSVGYGTSLLEATVSEGLATSYEKQVCGSYPIKHGDYSNIEELLQFYRERNTEEDERYNHGEWFFGKNEKYPKWLGYRVGTYIVEEVLKNNPSFLLTEITKMPAAKILALSNVKL